MLFNLLACGVIALLLLHSVPAMEARRQARQWLLANDGTVQVADWLNQNAPSDALLLGSGWWLPWEVAVLTKQQVADVSTSALSLADLRRPRFLVIRSQFLGQVELDPTVVNVMQRPELLVYEAGGVSVYRWPVSTSASILGHVQAMEVDLLRAVAEGRANLVPPPKNGILDHQHGNFVYPATAKMLRGIIMIAPSAMTTEEVQVQSGQHPLLLYSPPAQGDGLTLQVLARTGDQTHRLWSEDIPVHPPLPDDYHVRVFPLAPFTGQRITLTLQVSPGPSGDATADWLFVGPLAIVR